MEYAQTLCMMYENQCSVQDFINLFKSAGHHIVKAQSNTDDHSQALLRNGKLQIHERFKSKSENVLAITEAWIISSKK
jgi:hypothetical protein